MWAKSMGKMRNSYKVLVEKPDSKRHNESLVT
jgi:hypothetical protein